MGFTELGQGDVEWQAVVDTLINVRVPYYAGISWLVEGLLNSKEELFSIELVCLFVGWLFRCLVGCMLI
jgi:hypothetical protein